MFMTQARLASLALAPLAPKRAVVSSPKRVISRTLPPHRDKFVVSISPKTVISKIASPKIDKLAVLDPLAVVTSTAIVIAGGAAGNVIGSWVYEKYFRPRRKSKDSNKKLNLFTSQFEIIEERIEERIKVSTTTIKKIRLTTPTDPEKK
jgi:hypothetical protein